MRHYGDVRYSIEDFPDNEYRIKGKAGPSKLK